MRAAYPACSRGGRCSSSLFGAAAPVALVLVPSRSAPASGFALFDVLWNTAMAERIPPEALSRVSSYDWMGSLILLPVGFLVAGPLAEATSAETVMILGGVLTAVVLALGLIPRETRMLRRIEYGPGSRAVAAAQQLLGRAGRVHLAAHHPLEQLLHGGVALQRALQLPPQAHGGQARAPRCADCAAAAPRACRPA